MTTSYSTLLGLALPVQGELSGTWGDTVNDYITKYLDSAVAGVQTISGTQTSVALSQTNGSTLVSAGAGATGSSQYMVINCTGTPASLLTISAPNTSKVYVVINATAQSVKLVGVTGPTAGVTLVTGENAVCAWNGSDFVKVASSVADGVTTISFGSTGLTPNTATSGAVSVAGTLAPANGGTGVSNNAAMTVTGSGNFAYTRTLTGATNVTFPTTGTLATLAGTETFTNKTLTTPIISSISNTGTLTLPTSTDTLVGRATTDTLTNKTLTTPIISSISNTGTLTLPTSTDTLVGRATTDTLTNKTLTSPTLTTPVLGTPSSGTLSACTADGTNKVGYLNIPQSGSAKVASYTLVVGDVGKFVVLGTSGTVVVPASIFAVGDAISVANNTAAAITCTSSAVTAYLGGTNTVVTSFSLASRGVCTILYVTASVVFITGNVS
jgi:hypothetical protein